MVAPWNCYLGRLSKNSSVTSFERTVADAAGWLDDYPYCCFDVKEGKKEP